MKAVKLHFIKTSTIDKSVVKLLFMVMMMIISNIEKKPLCWPVMKFLSLIEI